jgi:hypothetical protein
VVKSGLFKADETGIRRIIMEPVISEDPRYFYSR